MGNFDFGKTLIVFAFKSFKSFWGDALILEIRGDALLDGVLRALLDGVSRVLLGVLGVVLGLLGVQSRSTVHWYLPGPCLVRPHEKQRWDYSINNTR